MTNLTQDDLNNIWDAVYPEEYVKETGKPIFSPTGADWYKYTVETIGGALETRYCLPVYRMRQNSDISLPAEGEEPVAFEEQGWMVGEGYYAMYDRTEEISNKIEKYRKDWLQREWEDKKELEQLEHYLHHEYEQWLERFDWKSIFRKQGAVDVFSIKMTSDNLQELEQFRLLLNEKNIIKNHYEVFAQGDIEKRGEEFSFELELSQRIEMQVRYTRVAGASYEGRQDVIAQMTDNIYDGKNVLKLERDPGNHHDQNAVKVMADIQGEWRQIGFLHREYTAEIAPLMDQGEYVHVELEYLVDEEYGYEENGEWHEWNFKGARILLVYAYKDERKDPGAFDPSAGICAPFDISRDELPF